MLNENLVANITTSLREHWRRPGFSDWEGGTQTYGDVARRIGELHHVFAACDVEPGDKIALIGRNSAHWATTFLATIAYGAVIVPILPDFSSDEIQHIVKHSDATFLFASETSYDSIDERRIANVRAIFNLSDYSLFHARDAAIAETIERAQREHRERLAAQLSPAELRFAAVGSGDLAAIVYTSGTTGFSKGVMLSHNAFMANVRFFVDNLDIDASNRVVSFLPLAHSFGCAFEFLAPVVCGCHITFIEKLPTPKILMRAFAEIRPRIILAVPLIIEKIYKTRILPQLESPQWKLALRAPLLSRLVKKKIRDRVAAVFGGAFQEIVVGGAALNRDVEEFFRDIGVPLANGYGMTECGPLISYTMVAQNPPAGSVGRVIPYLECKIVETDAQHGLGEICVRGENLMLGYYKDAEATSAAIDGEGWLHTGDLGRFDADGFLYLTGRSKNMILSASGQNVYPEEIEAKLNNLPYVGESLVLEDNGRLVALVYPDVERADAENLDERDLAEIMERNRLALNARLPAFSGIGRVKLIFDEFEKTPTKKIKRRLYDVLHE